MKYLKYFPYLVILILVWFLFAKGCNSTPHFAEPRIVYKTKVVRWEKDKDSTKAEIKKEDITRIKYIVKWRELKADTVYKECQELIVVCDSVILIDSTEISSLKHLNEINDSIIATQKIMLRDDSLDIKCLKKQIRKHKRHKFFLATALVLVGSAAVLK